MTSKNRFAVGIDLGTTNCALGSCPLDAPQAEPAPFPIPQTIHPSEVGQHPLLPSFLYLPAPDELAPGALALPWNDGVTDAVGVYARARGAESPARVVSSAKSWLSYDGVDRRGDILPWQAPEGVPRLSPVAAATRYLEHLRDAWNSAHPESLLGDQDVVLTVPASFDAVARELTVEAAGRAGLSENLRLLEEPQAALYAWLADRGPRWRDELSVGELILVCDIGGGTTDFSLIAVREEEGQLVLDRVAVGDHILLGGDNMDLALAYAVRARIEGAGTKLDDWQMRALIHGCRLAKEALLDDPERKTHPLVIPGRGSRLVGGTVRAELERGELESILLDGFFPEVSSGDRPHAPRRVGLTSLGLPYAADAGVTRHLAAFLGRGERQSPTAILFNGGVMRSPILRERIHALLTRWCEERGAGAPRVLPGADPDLAVGRGACAYAYARHHGGVRIRGGTARSHYVGVEQTGLAVPGLPPRIEAVCVAPFGMEEGSEVELSESFGLVVGEPVSFRFFASAIRRDDAVATVVEPGVLEELAPIEVTLDGQAGVQQGALVHVRLHARVTEVGTLELAAVEEDTGRRWKLSFDVRVQ